MGAPGVTEAERDALIDTDRAVAEALGFTLDKRCHSARVRGWERRWGRGPIQPGTRGLHFYPSTSWDDAMFAAEQFALFDHPAVNLSLSQIDGEWVVQEHGIEDELTWFVPPSAGPLAICSAILKIHGDKQA